MAEKSIAPVLDAPLPGTPIEVLPGVVRLTASNPSLMTGPGTNTYLVGRDSVVVIDPGPNDNTHLEAVEAAAHGRLCAIVVTHTHPDHAPGAAVLSDRTGVPVLGFDHRDGFEPDEVIGEGSEVEAGDVRLTALHTPGHASNHLCYLAALPAAHGPATRVLFSGDHVMGGSTVVIAPPDGDMAAYVDSLRRLAALAPPISVIAPGHGPMVPEPGDVLDSYIRHRRARENAIVASLAARGRAGIPDIVSDVYTEVPEPLHPIARFSVWAHLRQLVDEGRAGCDDVDDISAIWTAI